jgi:NAD(P)-dependent dehydrogenase (short-subunit alcohol dehydrogenase family)
MLSQIVSVGCNAKHTEGGAVQQPGEAYDVSKAALSHLVRELAISLSPKIRVTGISPATVIKGSTMFPAIA